MRIAPLPALVVVTAIQALLAVCLAYMALKASINHQRTAELYSEHLRLRELSPTGEFVPLSFVRLASEDAAGADWSFSVSLALSFAILAFAGFQLWFSAEAWREQKMDREKSRIHVSKR